MSIAPLKTVNLLPAWYRKELRQRRRLRLQVVLMLALGAGLLTWMHFAHQRLKVLRGEVASLQTQVRMAPEQGAAIEAARADLARLAHRQLAYRELGHTVPMSKVIQQVVNDMAPGMSLSKLFLDVRSEAIKGSGFVGDPNNPPKYHDVARITVVGVAPNDTLIAQLVGKLSANPLFDNVSLNFTHREVLRDYLVRRFEINMTMDMDRLATEAPQMASTDGGRK